MGIQNIAVTKYFYLINILFQLFYQELIIQNEILTQGLQIVIGKPFVKIKSLIIHFKYFSPFNLIIIQTNQLFELTPNHNQLNPMQLDQSMKTFGYHLQKDDLLERFTLKQIAQAKSQQILQIIMEKDRMIRAFSQQITKFKAEELKAKKLISSLQEKIQKTLPSNTNTSNSFMIPSEFKALFITFMTSTVPSVLYDFTQNTTIYSILFKSILQAVYSKLELILKKKTVAICNILISGKQLQLEENTDQKHQKILSQDQNLREQIRYHLLSFLQKYFQKIFPLHLNKISSKSQEAQVQVGQVDKQIQALFRISFPKNWDLDQQIQQKIETLNSQQTQKSDQLKQFFAQLYRICVYMILQQHPWQFDFDSQPDSKGPQNQSAKQFYTKKQFTCIDGFVKQGSEVKMVLKGIKRKDNSLKEYHYHPNIKNFVLPKNDDEQQIPETFQLKVDNLFFKEFNHLQQVGPSSQQNMTKESLKDITLLNPDQQSLKIANQPSPEKNVLKLSKAPQTNLLKNTQSSLPVYKSKLLSEQSFRVEVVSQTQKSQLIQSSLIQRQTSLIENDSNCIIELTQSYKQKRKLSREKQIQNFHQDKQNINDNMNLMKPDKKISTNSKKQKCLLEKNMMKKHKKEKNNSTIDLTTQKHKTNQKDHIREKENIQNNIHKKKQQDMPLTREIPKSSKKKGVGKSSRKCSVGKIISQSAQMTGSNTHAKQKISLSQHNTMVMKEPLNTKPLKENQLVEDPHKTNLQNKQNINNLVSHMYEKQIMRPKKSAKMTKNDEKPLILSVVQGQKEERPLAIRSYQNSCLVGKLREKYLLG